MSARRCAVITGVTGQDGTYLAELLNDRGYRVIGTTRSGAKAGAQQAAGALASIELVEDDLSDQVRLEGLLRRVAPDEVYHLAARASSADLFTEPVLTAEVNGVATVRLLEAVRLTIPRARFFQALSSELYGVPVTEPQDEATPFSPVNPYAAAKLMAYWMVRVYREHHGLHASSGILYNHESPRRAAHFVTRKISLAAAAAGRGENVALQLGALDARRDWSYAGDFVEAMTRITAHPRPDDYVLASGISHSVADFCEAAFRCVGLDYRPYVTTVPELARVTDNSGRVGNAAKARRQLGWQPAVDFDGLVKMMVTADLTSTRQPRGQ
jgi:GDPmannose 4,6-dehydratase